MGVRGVPTGGAGRWQVGIAPWRVDSYLPAAQAVMSMGALCCGLEIPLHCILNSNNNRHKGGGVVCVCVCVCVYVWGRGGGGWGTDLVEHVAVGRALQNLERLFKCANAAYRAWGWEVCWPGKGRRDFLAGMPGLR